MININKKQLHELIDRMPENFTLEDLQHRIFILQKLAKAEEQMEQGCETTSLAEMRELAKSWHDDKSEKK